MEVQKLFRWIQIQNWIGTSIVHGMLVLFLGTCTHVLADTVYLSKDEALELVLGERCQLEYRKETLPEDLIKMLDERDVEPSEDPVSHIFICRHEGAPTGYAFIDSEIGKHLPITFIVGVSPEGKVTQTEIMVYREEYGAQVHEPHFLEQFIGKSAADSLDVGGSIRHLSGATISSMSIARGVSRNLMIWSYYFGKKKDA